VSEDRMIFREAATVTESKVTWERQPDGTWTATMINEIKVYVCNLPDASEDTAEGVTKWLSGAGEVIDSYVVAAFEAMQNALSKSEGASASDDEKGKR